VPQAPQDALEPLVAIAKITQTISSKENNSKSNYILYVWCRATNNDKLTFDMRTLVTFNFTRGQISPNQVHTRQMFPVGSGVE